MWLYLPGGHWALVCIVSEASVARERTTRAADGTRKRRQISWKWSAARWETWDDVLEQGWAARGSKLSLGGNGSRNWSYLGTIGVPCSQWGVGKSNINWMLSRSGGQNDDFRPLTSTLGGRGMGCPEAGPHQRQRCTGQGSQVWQRQTSTSPRWRPTLYQRGWRTGHAANTGAALPVLMCATLCSGLGVAGPSCSSVMKFINFCTWTWGGRAATATVLVLKG